MLLSWSRIHEKNTRFGIAPRIQITPVFLFIATVLSAIVQLCHCFMGVESLTSSLATRYSSACGGQYATLSCPPPTLITVQYAKYGRSVPSSQMCGDQQTVPASSRSNNDLRDVLASPTPRPGFQEDTRCVAVRSLAVMIDLCEDLPRCSVLAVPETFTQDPCAGTSKYLEAHYKCRPNDTQKVTVCEGDELSIRCQKRHKILINSAMYGRSPQGDDRCPAKKGGHIDCQLIGADSRVKEECNFYRYCDLTVSSNLFGDPCPIGIYKYLTVSYTCVPKETLKLPDHIKKQLSKRKNRRRKKKKKKKDVLEADTTVANEIATEVSRDQTTDQSEPRIYETYEQTSATRILPLATEELTKEENGKYDPAKANNDTLEARPPAEASSQTPDITLGPVDILEDAETSTEDSPSLTSWEEVQPMTTGSPGLREDDSTAVDLRETGPQGGQSKELLREGEGFIEDFTASEELESDWTTAGIADSTENVSTEETTDQRDLKDITSIETDTHASVIIDENTQESSAGTDRSSSLLAAVTSIPNRDSDRGRSRLNSRDQPKDSVREVVTLDEGIRIDRARKNHDQNTSSRDKASGTSSEKPATPPKSKDKSSRNDDIKSPYVTERNLTILCINFTGSKDKRDDDNDADFSKIRRPRDERTIGFLKDWFTVIHYLDANEEKAWLYFTLGICFGIIVMLIVVLVKVCINFRRNIRARLDVSDPTHRSALINNHGNGPDPLDAPMLEHSDSIDRIEVVRFSPRSTLRSMRGNARENRDLVNYYG